MEVPIMNGLTFADIYISSINLVIMIDGPAHFYIDAHHIEIPNLIKNYI